MIFFNLVAEERKWRTRLTTVQRNAKDDHESCVLFHIKKKKGYLIIKEIIIIGKKPLSSMCCLCQPITAASDHLKWRLTGNICIFFTILMGSDRRSSSRLCIQAAKRSFSGWSHIWTCWDLKMTLRWKGERSVDSLHSDVCMEVFRSDEYQRSWFKVLV